MKSINILGIHYDIEFVTDKELLDKYSPESKEYKDLTEVFGSNLEGFAGLCHNRTCKIMINKECKEEKIHKVLLHEIMEAIKNESQIELDHIDLQAIVNGLWCAGIISLDKLVKDEPEDLSIDLN